MDHYPVEGKHPYIHKTHLPIDLTTFNGSINESSHQSIAL